MSRLTFSFLLALCMGPTLWTEAFAQEKKAPRATTSCDRERDLAILQEQIAASRTFNDQGQRIVVLLRAGDLWWPHQQDKARAVFVEAFELANAHYKETGDKPHHEGFGLAMVPLDQRYAVIGAIAKRDPAWARKLTDELLSEERRDEPEKNTRTEEQETRTTERLLSLASGLIASDQAAALSFARSSLRHPATLDLPLFLYRFAEINRAAADQFYLEALAAHAKAPLERLLYLSSYPFGNDREAGEVPGYTIYRVPKSFVPNPGLQRSFVQVLLLRTQQRLQLTEESSVRGRVSEAGQLWLAFTRLDKQIQRTLPDLAAPVEQAKTNVYQLLSPGSQSKVNHLISQQNKPARNLDEEVELSEKDPNVDRRDSRIASAVVSASANEDLDFVLRVIDKISDSEVRLQLLNWLHFSLTQDAIKNKDLTEARKLAAKVDELDQRAFLYFQIAEESLKQNPDQTQAREMLEEVGASAAKALPTIVTARTQLGVAYLYTKIDLNRAIAVLGEAVRIINRIEQPDFSRQFVIRKIEGKTFGIYATLQTPGFNPENAFQELGKVDFEGTLYQASNFTDKSLRARTSLAIIEPCLRQPTKAKKEKLKKGVGLVNK